MKIRLAFIAFLFVFATAHFDRANAQTNQQDSINTSTNKGVSPA